MVGVRREDHAGFPSASVLESTHAIFWGVIVTEAKGFVFFWDVLDAFGGTVVDQQLWVVGIHFLIETRDSVLVPVAEAVIEPDHVYRAVIIEQLLDLIFVVVVVNFVVTLEVVGVSPVTSAVVPADLELVFFTRLLHHADRVTLVGSVGDGEVLWVVCSFSETFFLGGPHAETVVVLGNKDEVFHAGIFGQAHELVGVEIGWIKSFVEVHVGLARDDLMFVATFDAIHHAPANFLTTDGGRAPVDKEAELGIAEPLKALFELLWCFVELRCWGWLR